MTDGNGPIDFEEARKDHNRRKAESMCAAFDDNDKAFLDELATLGRVDYDRRREDAAQQLDVRVSTLDAEVQLRRPKPDHDDTAAGSAVLFADPKPWPDPVDGASILAEIADIFTKYVILPEGAADALAIWVMHAHAHDAAWISPILAFESPEKRCGKTTALTILQNLAPRSLPTSNITPAALFRAVEAWHPTLLIDEADSFLKNSDDMRGILNSGHNKSGAFVIRTTGDDHEPKTFSTWAPKAIALIGELQGTLADRAISVRFQRKQPGEHVERVRLDRLGALERPRRQAARWATDNMVTLTSADPDMPPELHDRAADNWRALIAIADTAGGDWPDRARRAARILTVDENDDTSAGVMLLEDIKIIFDERHIDRIASADLVTELVKHEDRPWVEWRKGKPITPRQVARLLSRYRISPCSVRAGEKNAKGYKIESFDDAFSSYLADRSVTTSQPAATNGFRDFRSVTPDYDVTDENPRKAAARKACDVVTDRNGGSREEGPYEVEL